jgi:hypothetical protein
MSHCAPRLKKFPATWVAGFLAGDILSVSGLPVKVFMAAQLFMNKIRTRLTQTNTSQNIVGSIESMLFSLPSWSPDSSEIALTGNISSVNAFLIVNAEANHIIDFHIDNDDPASGSYVVLYKCICAFP